MLTDTDAVDEEAYYHSIFYAVMTILGFDMEAEVAVSKGRVDAAVDLGDGDLNVTIRGG